MSTSLRFGRALALGALLGCLGAGLAQAQSVLIAPQAVVISGGARNGSFTVVNVGEDRVEVDLSTLYGIPVTDSAGRMLLDTKIEVADTTPSATTWIEMFPRRLILEPGGRRTVRLLITPPAGIVEREYWARLVVASRVITNSAASAKATDVNVAITLEVRSVFPFLYRHGAVSTAVTIGELAPDVTADSVMVRVPLARRGNAAWVGTVRATINAPDGKVVRELEVPFGVYYQLKPRFALGLEGLPTGRYQLKVEATARRGDLPAAFVLPAAPVTQTVEFVRP